MLEVGLRFIGSYQDKKILFVNSSGKKASHWRYPRQMLVGLIEVCLLSGKCTANAATGAPRGPATLPSNTPQSVIPTQRSPTILPTKSLTPPSSGRSTSQFVIHSRSPARIASTKFPNVHSSTLYSLYFSPLSSVTSNPPESRQRMSFRSSVTSSEIPSGSLVSLLAIVIRKNAFSPLSNQSWQCRCMFDLLYSCISGFLSGKPKFFLDVAR